MRAARISSISQIPLLRYIGAMGLKSTAIAAKRKMSVELWRISNMLMLILGVARRYQM